MLIARVVLLVILVLIFFIFFKQYGEFIPGERSNTIILEDFNNFLNNSENLTLVRIYINDSTDFNKLDKITLDYRDEYGTIPKNLTSFNVLLSPSKINQLYINGFRFDYLQEISIQEEVSINISSTITGNVVAGSSFNYFTLSNTYEQVVAQLQYFQSQYPSLAKLYELTTTSDGRKVYAMKISDNVAVKEEDKGRLLIVGSIHGNEPLGTPMSLYFINYLLSKYSTNSSVKNIVDNREIWFIPILNPYGYVNDVRRNANNVDLNRNFGTNWVENGACCGTCPSACHYKNNVNDVGCGVGVGCACAGTGSFAFSERETQAYRDLVKANYIKYSYTVHGPSGKGMTFVPWSAKPVRTSFDYTFRALAQNLVDIGNVQWGNTGRNYSLLATYSQPPNDVYCDFGDENDYQFGENVEKNRTFGFINEVPGGSPLNWTKIYGSEIPMLMYMLSDPISCLNNIDCGTNGYVGNRFCSGNNVRQAYIAPTCVSPNSGLSGMAYCSNNTIDKTIQTCSDYCSAGVCASYTCHNNFDCNDNNIATQDICQNPNTLSSQCAHVSITDPLFMGLNAYWPFDSNASDLINQNNGLVFAPVISIGTKNNSYSFDGYNDYLLVNSSASLNVNSMTLSAWIYLSDLNDKGIIGKYDNHGEYSYVFWYKGGKIYFEIGSDNVFNTSVNSNVINQANKWYYVVGTYDQQKIRLYVDGILVASVNENRNIGAGSFPLCFGTVKYDCLTTNIYANKLENYFKGKIDDVKLYTRALSDSEVLSLSGINYNFCNNNGLCESNLGENTANCPDECKPICTSFTYSSWTVCNSSALQTRIISSQNPVNCTGGISENLIQQCSPPCLESNWQSMNSTCLSSNTLTTNWTKIGNCNSSISGSVDHSAFELVSCNYLPGALICNDFAYSNWSGCFANGIQNRSLIISFPVNCTDGNPILTQACNYTSPVTELGYTYQDIYPDNSNINNNLEPPVYSTLSNNSGAISIDISKKNNSIITLDQSEKNKPGIFKKFFVTIICKLSNLFNSKDYNSCLIKYGA